MSLLLLVAALLAVEPSARLALADDPAPPQFVVAGVTGATVRAEPNGSSIALAILPAGAMVSLAGVDVVTNGVVWRPVRTADGTVGYLPAGLLAPVQGSAEPGRLPPGEAAPPLAVAQPQPAAPSQSVGAPPSQSVGSVAAPRPVTPVATPALASAPDGSAPPPSGALPPAPTPAATLPAPRTTVEWRRGRQVTVTHVDRETAPDGHSMGAGRIVVGFKAGASQDARTDAHRAAGADAAQRIGLPDVAVVQVAPGTVSQALAAYRGRPDVAWAEPDYVRRAIFTPNDPQVGAQWGLQKIGAPIAWDVTQGAPSTRVAVLDCGIFSETSSYVAPDGQTGHPDLRGKVVAEANFTDATTGTDDYCDHGTLMAGIVGARTNTSPPTGVAGVGFNVQVLNGKVLNDNGDGYDSWVASGIVWAADNGARVISMSLGGDGPCSATLQSAADYAWSRGAVIVAAAGNGGPDGWGDPTPQSPGACQHVIPVGAIDERDERATFSNYGPAVPLAAPGVNVLSTDYIGSYDVVSGTSPATPHVAAVAGLLWSTPYGSSNQSIVDRLLQTADPIVGAGSTWANGRVNAAAAVGPASCSPRPRVTVSSTADGSALRVKVSVAGAGNALRFVQVGTGVGTATNALVTFPGTASASPGTTTYVPSTVTASTTFQLRRQAAGQPSTLAFAVTDGCGVWKSFAGGGTAAGF